MFTLTKKTDYAIIALSHMAQRPGQVCNAREIAQRFGAPVSLLMNVLKAMTHGELIRSIRGVKGGYTLARPADEITLYAIINAIEGPVRFVQCTEESRSGESLCELFRTCPVTRPVRKVHRKLVEFLKDITLAEIAHDSGYGEEGAYLTIAGAAGKEPKR